MGFAKIIREVEEFGTARVPEVDQLEVALADGGVWMLHLSGLMPHESVGGPLDLTDTVVDEN